MAIKKLKYLFLAGLIATLIPYQATADDNINTIHLRSQNRIAKLYQNSKKNSTSQPQIKSTSKAVPDYIPHRGKSFPKAVPAEEDIKKASDELDNLLNNDNDFDEPHTKAEMEKRHNNCTSLCGPNYSYSHMGYKNGGKEKICIRYPLDCKEQCTIDWKTEHLVNNTDYTCKEAIQVTEPFPFVGPLKAKVTITEFVDFYCGYCKQFAPDILKLIKANPKVKFVFKPKYFLGSEEVARAFIATSRQGKTLEAYYAFMNTSQRLSSEQIDSIIRSMNLKVAKTRSLMEDEKTQDTLTKVDADFYAYGIRGVPRVLINNEPVAQQNYDFIQKLIYQYSN